MFYFDLFEKKICHKILGSKIFTQSLCHQVAEALRVEVEVIQKLPLPHPCFKSILLQTLS